MEEERYFLTSMDVLRTTLQSNVVVVHAPSLLTVPPGTMN